MNAYMNETIIKQRIADHETWLRTNKQKGCQAIFENLDMSHMTLRNHNLSNSVWRNVNLEHATFDNLNISNSQWYNCNAQHSRFTDVNLSACDIESMQFAHAAHVRTNLNTVRMFNSDFNKVHFENCTMTHALCQYVNFSHSIFQDVYVEHTIAPCIFRNVTIKGRTSFTKCELHNSAWSNLNTTDCHQPDMLFYQSNLKSVIGLHVLQLEQSIPQYGVPRTITITAIKELDVCYIHEHVMSIEDVPYQLHILDDDTKRIVHALLPFIQQLTTTT